MDCPRAMGKNDVFKGGSEVGANGGHFGYPRYVVLEGRTTMERRLGTVGMGDRKMA